jgi:hypothetical protein
MRQCLDWCHDYVDQGRFADQGYLDEWPARYQGLHVIPALGANVAPWNVEQYLVSLRHGVPRVDAEPVIFYHFHGLRSLDRHLYALGLERYGVTLTWPLRDLIYAPYLSALARAQRMAHAPGVPIPSVERQAMPSPRRHAGGARGVAEDVAALLSGRFILNIGGRSMPLSLPGSAVRLVRQASAALRGTGESRGK